MPKGLIRAIVIVGICFFAVIALRMFIDHKLKMAKVEGSGEISLQ